MQLTTIFFFAALILCESRRLHKRNSDRENLSRLVSQLSRVKDVAKFNLYVERNVKSKAIDLLRITLTRYLPVMSMSGENLKLFRYQREIFDKTRKICRNSREQHGLMNFASRNSLLIYVHSNRNGNPNLKVAGQVYHTLAFSRNLPRVLVVSVTSKRLSSYNSTLNLLLTQLRILDVGVLEISSFKLKKKPLSEYHRFTVHRYDPFSRIYEKHKFLPKTKWFINDKSLNLHGQKLVTRFLNFSHDFRKLGNSIILRKQNPDVAGENCNLMMHLKSTMNFTLVNKKFGAPAATKANDITLPGTYIAAYRDYCYVKPSVLTVFEIYVPVISDSDYQLDVNCLPIYFFTILAIILLLQACAVIGKLNARIWSPLMTVRMLLAHENPHSPVGARESMLFLLLSTAGMFFSNELYESMTKILNPVKLERPLSTFEDLRANNVTILLDSIPKDRILFNGRCNETIENLILKAKVNYVVGKFTLRYSRGITYMLRFLNLSVSVASGSETASSYSATIKAFGRLRARRSNMAEHSWIKSILLQKFSPHYERISDLTWRFYECGFSNYLEYKRFLSVWSDKFRDHQIYDETQLEHSEGNEEFKIMYLLLTMLVCGSILSITFLICEILYCKYMDRIERRIKIAVLQLLYLYVQLISL